MPGGHVIGDDALGDASGNGCSGGKVHRHGHSVWCAYQSALLQHKGHYGCAYVYP